MKHEDLRKKTGKKKFKHGEQKEQAHDQKMKENEAQVEPGFVFITTSEEEEPLELSKPCIIDLGTTSNFTTDTKSMSSLPKKVQGNSNYGR